MNPPSVSAAFSFALGSRDTRLPRLLGEVRFDGRLDTTSQSPFIAMTACQFPREIFLNCAPRCTTALEQSKKCKNSHQRSKGKVCHVDRCRPRFATEILLHFLLFGQSLIFDAQNALESRSPLLPIASQDRLMFCTSFSVRCSTERREALVPGVVDAL